MNGADHLKRFLGPIERRIRTMLMRGTLAGADDTGDLQKLQVTRLDGETFDDCERVGQYGLSSVPVGGAEVIIAQIGSNADHQVAIGIDDRSRPHPLSQGQTALYDSSGTVILLDAAGNVSVTSSGTVSVTAPSIVLHGNVHVTGNVQIDGLLNGHTP